MSYFFLIIVLFFLFFIFNIIAYKLKLLDFPNEIKIHLNPTPLIGGLCIYLSLAIIYFFSLKSDLLFLLLFSSIPLLIIGIIDDLYSVDYKIRILFQLMTIMLFIYLGLTNLNLGNFFIFNLSKFYFLNILFIIIFFIVIINSFNFMDGQDGLISLISLISLIFFSIILYLNNIQLEQIIFYLFISLLIFLLFNLNIFSSLYFFLGDAGSTLIAFLLSATFLYYLNHNEEKIKMIQILWIFAVPVFDFFRVTLNRVTNRQLFFKGDKSHIHHLLIAAFGKNNSLLVIILLCFFLNIIGFISIIYFGELFSQMLFFFILLFYILFFKILKI